MIGVVHQGVYREYIRKETIQLHDLYPQKEDSESRGTRFGVDVYGFRGLWLRAFVAPSSYAIPT